MLKSCKLLIEKQSKHYIRPYATLQSVVVHQASQRSCQAKDCSAVLEPASRHMRPQQALRSFTTPCKPGDRLGCLCRIHCFWARETSGSQIIGVYYSANTMVNEAALDSHPSSWRSLKPDKRNWCSFNECAAIARFPKAIKAIASLPRDRQWSGVVLSRKAEKTTAIDTYSRSYALPGHWGKAKSGQNKFAKIVFPASSSPPSPELSPSSAQGLVSPCREAQAENS
jgi:hypothetical protein